MISGLFIYRKVTNKDMLQFEEYPTKILDIGFTKFGRFYRSKLGKNPNGNENGRFTWHE